MIKLLHRFLNTSVLQFMGRISMALYLVQMPVIEWVKMAIYGPFLDGPFLEPRPSYTWKLPLWSTPIPIIASVILAAALTIFLEEPVKKRLRKLLTSKNTANLQIAVAAFLAIGAFLVILVHVVFSAEIVL